MREILRRQIEAIRAEPVERGMKPAIKAAVAVGLLSVAAICLSEGYDRKGLARLAGDVQPAAKSAPRRP